jgi:hypothetical protein
LSSGGAGVVVAAARASACVGDDVEEEAEDAEDAQTPAVVLLEEAACGHRKRVGVENAACAVDLEAHERLVDRLGLGEDLVAELEVDAVLVGQLAQHRGVDRRLERATALVLRDGPRRTQRADEDADQCAARDEPRAEEHAGRRLLLLLGELRPPIGPLAHEAAEEDRRGRRDREVGADRERQRRNAAQLHHDREEDADQHELPRQVAAEHAVDDELEETGFRRIELRVDLRSTVPSSLSCVVSVPQTPGST